MSAAEQAMREAAVEECFEILGRISSGWDADTDFDALPTRMVDIDEEHASLVDLFQGDGPDAALAAEEFRAPVEHFPTLKRAIRYYQSEEATPQAVRIDTPESYNCEKAVHEVERKLEELRAVVDAHVADGHGGKQVAVLGAVAALASTGGPSPSVPVDVPPALAPHVKCWQEGDFVVCSLRFGLPNGQQRIATVASKPLVDEGAVGEWLEENGHDSATVLGMVSLVAAAVAGRKLLRDAARAAEEARHRPDVQAMSGDEPLVILGLGADTAPLAALMDVQQRADSGDEQAQEEMTLVRAAAETPKGRECALPLIEEADRRLALGRVEKRAKGALEIVGRLRSIG